METDKRHQALQILDQALYIARCVESRDERAWLYVQISHSLLKAGERQRARELVEKCLHIIVGNTPCGRYGFLLRWAAQVLAELGEVERGWNLLRLSSEGYFVPGHRPVATGALSLEYGVCRARSVSFGADGGRASAGQIQRAVLRNAPSSCAIMRAR